jgi:hypothetical protein
MKVFFSDHQSLYYAYLNFVVVVVGGGVAQRRVGLKIDILLRIRVPVSNLGPETVLSRGFSCSYSGQVNDRAFAACFTTYLSYYHYIIIGHLIVNATDKALLNRKKYFTVFFRIIHTEGC